MFFSLRNFHPLRVAASAGLKGALPKVLVGAALLGGGGSVLFAGSAQAVNTTCAALGDLTAGDKRVTGLNCFGDIEGNADVLIQFNESLNKLDYIFNSITGPGSLVGGIEYNISIDPVLGAGRTFGGIELDSECDNLSGGSCTVNKAVYSGSLAGALLDTLVSVNGVEDFSSAGAGLTSLGIRDSWTTTAPGVVTGVENVFNQTVPGPLPLLGAGMAFGFSRKLRSRIKARAQA